MEGLVHAEVTDDLCGVGAATLAGDLVRRHSLDRLVVGACACCPQDQRCAACNPERAGLREAVKAATQLPWSHHAFVNLRDHHTITNEAVAVIAMAIARMDATPQDVPHRGSREPVRAALVIGAGAVGRAAAVELGERGIPTHLVDQAAPTGAGSSAPRNITLHVPSVVMGLEGGGGDFRVTVAGMGEGVLLRVGAVLVAPGLAEEETGSGVGWGLPHRSMETSPRRIQGTFLAGEDGTSSAGAVAAFLGRTLRGTQAVAFVDPEACISCMKCLPVCPYSAISRPSVPDGAVLVDPLLCAGCGACTSACMNWAVDQTGHSTVELEAAIRAGAKRMRALLVVCNWSAYRAMDQACQDGLLPKGVAKLRVPCLAHVSPHLVQVALDSGVDPLIIAGCSERGCHFRGRRGMLEEHMANLEAGLAGTGDLDRIFVVSLGPTDKDVLATRVVEALESRRYAREERGPITEHAKDTEWTRGWSA
jgi:coenzyme F420-reducing hydrogenase delta subunit/Pyruvate/2-oxoacid:ferredoxin oxidoreductase delta subunit